MALGFSLPKGVAQAAKEAAAVSGLDPYFALFLGSEILLHLFYEGT